MSASASEDIRVVGVCGSLRLGSYTRMALVETLLGAQGPGVATQLIDLREYRLPFVASSDGEELQAPDVVRLRAEVKSADGIILGTPEYHGSFSGPLKNALDLMGFEEFEGKMIGLVGVSGGRMGAFDALNALRSVGRSLHAWVLPQQASIPEAWAVFDGEGRIKDNEVGKRLREIGGAVARFARVHKCAHADEFLQLWQQAPDNPGADGR